MILVPYTVTALAESDAVGTDGKNIVVGAVVTLQTPAGGVVTMYDDAAGANPSTAKATGAKGQVIVFIEPGEYQLFINGNPRGKFGVTDDLSSVQSTRVVQIPQQYPTLQAAIDALHGRRFTANGAKIRLVISAGHQITSGVSVRDGDFSMFSIESEDAVVTVAPEFTGTPLKAFNAIAPTWSILVDVNNQAIENNIDGNFQAGISIQYNSKVLLTSGAGVRNVGTVAEGKGVAVFVGWGSEITCTPNGRYDFTGSKYRGLWVSHQSNFYGNGDFTASTVSHGGFISRGSQAYIAESLFKGGQGDGLHVYRSKIIAPGGFTVEDFAGVAIDCQQAGYISAEVRNDKRLVIRNCNRGLFIRHASQVAIREAHFEDVTAECIINDNASITSANLATAVNCGRFVRANGGSVDIQDTNSQTTVGWVEVNGQASVNARGAIAVNTGEQTLGANSGNIDLTDAVISGAAGTHIRCTSGAIVSADRAVVTGATLFTADIDRGAQLNAQDADLRKGAVESGTDMRVLRGGMITATGAAQGGFSVQPNVLTRDGVIFNNAASVRQVQAIDSIDDLRETRGFFDGQQVSVASYHAGLGKGGGVFVATLTGSPIDDNGVNIAAPNTQWTRLGLLDVDMLGGVDDKLQAERVYNLLVDGWEFRKPEQVTHLNKIGAEWYAGNKYPIAIFGDSTTDGVSTTTNGTDNATVFNGDRLVSGNVPDGWDIDHDDNEVPNAHPNILQRLAREFFNNSELRVYNAGFRAQRLTTGWGERNIYNAIYGHPVYSDAKAVGFMFGINDVNLDGSDTDALIEQHYLHTKALIIDAFARGVQPFLITCSVTGSKENSGFSMWRIASTVDQMKRQLADELNVPLVDIGKWTEDYIYNNDDANSYYDLGPDGVHLKDLGNLKQAQFMLRQIAGDALFIHADDQVRYFDITNKAVRTVGLSGNQSGLFTVNRGRNQLYRNIFFTPAELEAVAGSSAVTAYIWCECRSASLIYSNLTNDTADGAEVLSYDNVLQYKLTQQANLIGTDDKFIQHQDPSSKGRPATYLRLDTPFHVGRLHYGLNKFELLVPASFDSVYLTGDYFFGSFHIAPDAPEDSFPVINRADHEDEVYLRYFNKRPWTDALRGYGPIVMPSQTAIRNEIVPYCPKVGNRGRLGNPGDWVEIAFTATYNNGASVVVAYNLDNGSSLPNLEFKRSAYTAGDKLLVSAATTNLFFTVLGPTDAAAFSFDMGAAHAAYSGKPLIIRLERNANNSGVTARLIDALTWDVLWSRDIGAADGAAQGRFEQWIGSFIVGGVATRASGAGGFELRKMSVRQINYDTDSLSEQLKP
jgi:lysophospholipase L1-like esterase